MAEAGTGFERYVSLGTSTSGSIRTSRRRFHLTLNDPDLVHPESGEGWFLHLAISSKKKTASPAREVSEAASAVRRRRVDPSAT